MKKQEGFDPKRPLITKSLMAMCVEKYGQAMLPQAAIIDFKEYHAEQIAQGKPKKYGDWCRAFRNYISWASPSGRFHSPWQWENWLEKAKKLSYGTRKRQSPAYHPNPGSKQPYDGKTPDNGGPKQTMEIAKAHLAKILGNM